MPKGDQNNTTVGSPSELFKPRLDLINDSVSPELYVQYRSSGETGRYPINSLIRDYLLRSIPTPGQKPVGVSFDTLLNMLRENYFYGKQFPGGFYLQAKPEARALVDRTLANFRTRVEDPITADFFDKLSKDENYRTLLAIAIENLSQEDAVKVLERLFKYWSYRHPKVQHRPVFVSEMLSEKSHRRGLPRIEFEALKGVSGEISTVGSYRADSHSIVLNPKAIDLLESSIARLQNELNNPRLDPEEKAKIRKEIEATRQQLKKVRENFSEFSEQAILHELVHANFTPSVSFIGHFVDTPEFRQKEEAFLKEVYGKGFAKLSNDSIFTLVNIMPLGDLNLYVLRTYNRNIPQRSFLIVGDQQFERLCKAYLAEGLLDSKLNVSTASVRAFAKITLLGLLNVGTGPGRWSLGVSLDELVAEMGAAVLQYYRTKRKPIVTYFDFVDAIRNFIDTGKRIVEDQEGGPKTSAGYAGIRNLLWQETEKVQRGQRSPILEIFWNKFMGGFAYKTTVPKSEQFSSIS
jgi:hypothetical protein